MRTIPNISEFLQDVENILQTEFKPVISGGITCSEKKRKLLSLLPKLRCLSIPIFMSIADFQFDNSHNFNAELQRNITEQTRT